MNSILVTGGSGFIGSSLIDFLLKSKISKSIINVDNFDNFYSPEIKKTNILNHFRYSNYQLYSNSIENKRFLKEIFKKYKIDLVIHLAARAGVRPSINYPLKYANTNILGTLNILELMREYGVNKIIFASSSSVYGMTKAKTYSENLKLNKPISPYAASKLACENFLFTYSHLFKIRTIILRFFTVYGPRQRPDLAINKFASLILENKPIDIYGNGNSTRDYTYIDDIIAGLNNSIDYIKKNNNDLFEVINLGSGSPVTLKEMVSVLSKQLKKTVIINKLPFQQGDMAKTYANITKAKKLLNFNPKISFKEGIKSFIEWKYGAKIK